MAYQMVCKSWALGVVLTPSRRKWYISWKLLRSPPLNHISCSCSLCQGASTILYVWAPRVVLTPRSERALIFWKPLYSCFLCNAGSPDILKMIPGRTSWIYRNRNNQVLYFYVKFDHVGNPYHQWWIAFFWRFIIGLILLYFVKTILI